MQMCVNGRMYQYVIKKKQVQSKKNKSKKNFEKQMALMGFEPTSILKEIEVFKWKKSNLKS